MRYFLFYGFFSFLSLTNAIGWATPLSCGNGSVCTIGLLESGSLDEYELHEITVMEPALGDQQSFSYDGSAFTTTCDGTWQELVTPDDFPVPVQNQFTCTIDNFAVTISLRIYSNRDHPADSEAAITFSGYLSETTAYEVSTTITQNGTPASGIASQWAAPGMDEQVILFSKTTIDDLVLAPVLTPNPAVEDTPTGESDRQDDGQLGPSGNCLGTLYVFNGKDSRCRRSGLQTAYTDCCDAGASLPAEAVAIISPALWQNIAGFDLDLTTCTPEEALVSAARDAGLCHYVGSYCSKRIDLIGCVQRKRTYCCFNSMLGRILQDQGRPTLSVFGGDGDWGTPKHPNCRGFTADEFQMLDFSRIDLSEWHGEIQTQTQQQITGTIENEIEQSYGP